MGAGESKHRSSQRPPDRPHPPGKPALVPGTPRSDPDIITIKWDCPEWNGGAKLSGYVVEQRRTGSAHWVRATPVLVRAEELTLSGLEPGMRYQFRVMAEGPGGRSHPGPTSEPIAVSYHRTFASAPCFVQPLKDTTVIENEQVEFTVQIQGTPTPKLVWYKDGFEVYSSRRQRIVNEGDRSTLVIHQAAFSDEGEIKCSATNKAGHIVTKAKLILEAPPTIRLPRQYEDGLLFELGETVRLKVSVAGRPTPAVTWLHNGEAVISDGRHDISTTERHTTLRIPEATRSDRGEYQVRASNRLGEDLTSFLVTITDRPLPPGKAHVVMTLGRCVTLSWTPPPDDGGCKIGNYIVEYYRIGWNMWLKAATCRQLTTTLGDLIEGSEYKFRVKAENPYGMSDPSDESDVVFIPDPKRGLLEPPPRDKRSLMDESEEWIEARKRHNELLEPAKTGPLRRDRDEVEEMPSEVVLAHQVLRKVKMAPKRGWSEDSQGSPPREPSPPIPPQRKYRIKQKLPAEFEKPKLQKIEEAEAKKKAVTAEAEAKKKAVTAEVEAKKGAVVAEAVPKKKSDLVDVEPVKPETDTTKPRKMEDNLHSSSEFMLVLLPGSRATTEEREEERRETIESLKSDESEQVAPPMSLSAPELSSCEPVEWGLLRASVSSSELMHERAMARMFQEASENEAEESLRRKYGVERKRSFERRTPRTKESAFSKELASSTEKITVTEPTELIQEDKEDLLLDETTEVQTPAASAVGVSGYSERFLQSDKVFNEFTTTFEEDIDLEEEESPYDEDSDTEEPARKRFFHLNDYLADEEEETYHPRSMVPKTVTLPTTPLSRRSITPEPLPQLKIPTTRADDKENLVRDVKAILKEPKIEPREFPPLEKEKDSSPVAGEVRKSKSPVGEERLEKQSPVAEAHTSELPSNAGFQEQNEVTYRDESEKSERDLDINLRSSKTDLQPLKPILKVREASVEKPEKKNFAAKLMGKMSNRSSKEEISSKSTEILTEEGKSRKKVRIEEPDSRYGEGFVGEGERKILMTGEVARNRRKARGGISADDPDPTKVVIEYYSDIVREFGHAKKPRTKIYVDYEDLKAAAERIESEQQSEVQQANESQDQTENQVSNDNINSNENITQTENSAQSEIEESCEDNTVAVKDMDEPVIVKERQKSGMDFILDLGLFLVACWLYLFEDERLAIPILFLMVYRQLNDTIREKLPKRWRKKEQ